MKDIENRQDIETLMVSFYHVAMKDDVIGHFFTQVVPLNLEKHIPLISDFWETVIFDKAAYRGNVFGVHEHIHTLFAFEDKHFERWVFLFKQTVDGAFVGANAEKIKQRGESIATVMRIKLVHSGIELKK
jgi:hemoglobin